jgi:hypothetical protein
MLKLVETGRMVYLKTSVHTCQRDAKLQKEVGSLEVCPGRSILGENFESMKTIFFLPLFACAFYLFGPSLSAQKIHFPPQFQQLLDQTGIEFFEPLDAGYRDIVPLENEYQSCHFAIRSKREDLQIRYFILPWNDGDPTTTNPHLATFRALTSVAVNSDEAVISAIQPEREKLRNDFNADWGMIYFFQPKPGFSELPACRMVSLCKEGKGTVFIFYLFDDPANEALDTRYLSLRFL